MSIKIEVKNKRLIIVPVDDDSTSDVNQIFTNQLIEIQNYLGLEPVTLNVVLKVKDDLHEESENFFDIGVIRSLTNNHSQIEISEKYNKFLPFILLREAYLCFIPHELREKEIIHIVIHEIIESDFSKSKAITQWKALVRKKIINYDYLLAQFDQLNKFFKLEPTEKTQSPTQFFFEFIRRNIPIIQDQMDNFYDLIWKEYIYKTSNSLFNDEMLETIRVLVKVFYQMKLFTNYNEYEQYFTEFKENGTISTNLSKRKFSENLRWINKCTMIGPSFQHKYHPIDIAILTSCLKFNPILNRKDIYKILDRIPFLHNPVFAKIGFSETGYFFFLVPRPYLKDLVRFIEKLYNFGYLLNKECYLWKEHSNILNLNYFRDYFEDLRKIINPNHKDYDNQFELSHKSLYDEPEKVIDLNLLEWLILEMAPQSSFLSRMIT